MTTTDRVIMVRESTFKEMREALRDLLHHEIAHVGPYAGQRVAAACAELHEAAEHEAQRDDL